MFKRVIAGLLALVAAAPLQAEVLSFTRLEAAGSDAAAALHSIAVSPFGGKDGPALGFRVEDALRSAQLEGRAYFLVLPDNSATQESGILRGTADSEQTINHYVEDHERCVKDSAGKCTDVKEKYKAKCQRRRIELSVMIRLTRSDGALLWYNDDPQVYQDSYCDDSNTQPRGRNDILRELTGNVANLVRGAFAPSERRETIRVNESRKGLATVSADRVKQAIRLTKTDARAACAIWESLAMSDPGHVPTLYNAALCRESQGNRDQAVAEYNRVLEFDSGNRPAREGLVRLEVDQLARNQIKVHDQR